MITVTVYIHSIFSDFTCDNGEDISLQWVCDHEDDCMHGEDEEQCSTDECKLALARVYVSTC